MLKRALLLLLSFQFAACSGVLPRRDVQSEVSGADKSLVKQFANQCSNLLYPASKQFDFSQFCDARAKYQDQIVTEAHFANWRKMPVEELMALIELHTLQVNASTKGLELEQLNARKRVRLKSEIERLQRTEKNVFARVRKLMSFWYETTHSENLKLSFKKNPFVIPQFFKKIRAEDRLARLEGELSARSAIAVFAEAGLVDNPSWWGSQKEFLRKRPNLFHSMVAVTVVLVPLAANIVIMLKHNGDRSVGDMVKDIIPVLMVPYLTFDSAKTLANEYEDLVVTKGHEEAKTLVLSGNMKRVITGDQYKTVANYVNTLLFVGVIAWVAVDRYYEKKEFNEKAQLTIHSAMTNPQDTREKEVKVSEYAIEAAEKQIVDLEARGIPLSEEDKAGMRKRAREAGAEVVVENASSSQ